MAKFDWNEAPLPPARIVDANGAEYHDVIWVDDQTGEMCRAKKDEKGNLYADPKTNDLAWEELTVPAPVQVEFLEKMDGFEDGS